jgi:hypothetical protein
MIKNETFFTPSLLYELQNYNKGTMAEVPITIIYDEIERLLKGEEIECHGFHANTNNLNTGYKITIISFYFSKPGYDVGILNPVVFNTLKTLGRVYFDSVSFDTNEFKPEADVIWTGSTWPRLSIKGQTAAQVKNKGYVRIYTKEYMDKIMNKFYEDLNKAISEGNQENILIIKNSIAKYTEEYSQNWFNNGCPAHSEYVLK